MASYQDFTKKYRESTLRNILELVEAQGTNVCAYSHLEWSNFCDCKYPIPGKEHQSSEVTGCPELREIREILRTALQHTDNTQEG